MVLTGLCFVALTGIVRWIGPEVPAAQAAFLRFAFGIVILAPALLPLLRHGLPAGTAPLFAGRGAVHVAAVILWFYAMARLPLAEVTAIGYLNPVLVMLGAALILGEAITRTRLLTVAAALIGAAMILRPGLREIGPGQLAQLGAAVCFAGSYLYAKRLSAIAPAGTVVAMLSVAATIGLAPLAALVWQPVAPAHLAGLAATAALGSAAHYAMTRAFAEAPMAVTQPVVFLQIVWASLLGAVVFGERADPWVIAGGAVIIAAISLNALADHRARPPAPPQPEP
jgi:drug/metabolite transporter (DMT)-like permease